MVSLLSPVTLTSLPAVEVMLTTVVMEDWDSGRILMGVWHWEMVAQRRQAGQEFYINKNGGQIIGLNRRETTNPVTPTGSYCCTVPTDGGVEMTLCANLGEWIIIALLLCVYMFIFISW